MILLLLGTSACSKTTADSGNIAGNDAAETSVELNLTQEGSGAAGDAAGSGNGTGTDTAGVAGNAGEAGEEAGDGDGGEDNGEGSAGATDSGAEADPGGIDLTEEAPLRFVDAWDEWHDMTIIPGLRAVPYRWDCLTNDASGIRYEGDDRYGIQRGIDVSKFQGTIDWEKVRGAGISFVIVRVGFRGYGTAGNMKADEYYRQNIEGAQAAGLDVGVYFFAQAVNEEEAIEEAQYVLDLIDGYTLELPVVYDPELIRGDESRTDHVTGEQFTKNTIAFCEAVRAGGYTPMIYSNMVWEAELFDMALLQKYPFWYADYETIPQTPYDFEYWQYSEKGHVDGIAGEVDLDIRFVPADE